MADIGLAAAGGVTGLPDSASTAHSTTAAAALIRHATLAPPVRAPRCVN